MEELYTVSLEKIIQDLSLSVVYLPDLPENIQISNKHVNRPGLSLTGFYDHFEQTRIELIGRAEHLYLAKFSNEERRAHLFDFMAHKPACLIFTSSLEVFPEAREAAEEYGVPLLSTHEITSDFMAALANVAVMALSPATAPMQAVKIISKMLEPKEGSSCCCCASWARCW